MVFAVIFVVLLFLLAVIIVGLNLYVNDYSVSKQKGAFDIDAPHTVLAVFAHPDDEVMVAGTISRLKKHGKVHALYLTHGEDGPTGGLVEQNKLGALREIELKHVGDILCYDGLEILDYPDRYLNTVDASVIKNEIKKRILNLKPDTMICFDDTIGLYGHTDHAFSGRCVQELLEESPLAVANLLVMTLSDKMINLAKKVSKTFRERFDDSVGLPQANFSVLISRYAKKKMNVVKAHKSQWQVMNDVQPLYNKIPAIIYYSIFSREYFSFKRYTNN